MQVTFENDFQKKIMSQAFAEGSRIETRKDVLAWRAAWTGALKSWHSPYKLIIDLSNMTAISSDPDVQDQLRIMVKFFEGLFLRKAAGYGLPESIGTGTTLLPFPTFATEADALAELGVREGVQKSAPGDFRSAIQIQNHFQQHVVEVNFSGEVALDSKDKVETLKSKLTNNLMQWHSRWSLLIDCTNLTVDPAVHPDFSRAERTLRGFFLKTAIGYSPKGAKETYPFPVYRARHAAVAQLEAEGKFSGDDAQCRSKAPG